MNSLLIIPIVAITLLSITTQLVDTADQVGEKTAAYAQEMNSAMDCAFLGKPLADCSPELLKTSFKEDINKTQKDLEEMQIKLNEMYRELENAQDN